MLQPLATPEADTLHRILQAIIIDGFQRMRPEADIKTNAEAAARAFRAGLAAFTAPPEARVSGSVNVNASIPVTVNYGGTKDAATAHQQCCNSMATAAGCANRDPAQHGSAAGYSFGQVGDVSGAMADPLAGIQAHIAAAADISAKSCSALAAFAALHRLADAAGKLPPSAQSIQPKE